jgi:hypothetical protein
MRLLAESALRNRKGSLCEGERWAQAEDVFRFEFSVFCGTGHKFPQFLFLASRFKRELWRLVAAKWSHFPVSANFSTCRFDLDLVGRRVSRPFLCGAEETVLAPTM